MSLKLSICASGLESNLLWKAITQAQEEEPPIRLSQAIFKVS